MPGKEEYAEIEEDIRRKRQLPYTLTVEKTDGNKIYTHNIWGNSIIYIKNDKDLYEVFVEKE